jgi:hypothetical protein
VADKSLDVPELVRSTFAEKPIALQSPLGPIGEAVSNLCDSLRPMLLLSKPRTESDLRAGRAGLAR